MFFFFFIVLTIYFNKRKAQNNYNMSVSAIVFISLLLAIIFSLLSPYSMIFLIWIFCSRFARKNNGQQGQNSENPYYNSFSQSRYSGYSTAPRRRFGRVSQDLNVSNPYDLPKREGGRKKIISKFNKKYSLNLTPQDIQTISSGTYMSLEWASEVYSMTVKYNSLYEWLGQGNSWLRVYLYVFNVQTISPVFNKQEEIVFQSFDTIFSEMCTDETLPTEVIIQNINNKFLTNFDEPTFMLAINYMESKGKRYRYGSPILTRVHSNIDDLADKYRTMQ